MEMLNAELLNGQELIIREIKNKATQTQVARTYALTLRSSEPTNWEVVNRAIVNRWSISGLERIKSMAWSGKCFE